MTMTEREELQLVAKAAGYDFRCESLWDSDFYTITYQDIFRRRWNPKEYDGDSRRLAVDLGIDLYFNGEEAVACQHELNIESDNLFIDHPDKYAAVRAAVWDVAVEVAKRRTEK